jgi:hypothetical protein
LIAGATIIMSKYSTLAFLGLGLLLLGPACSKSDTYYLLVDVSLETGVQTPDSVILVATQNQATLKLATVSWSLAKAGVLEVGLVLPNDTTIPVVVTGSAYLGSQLVGRGMTPPQTIIGGRNNGPVALLIKTLPVTVVDGGVPDSAADGPGSGETPAGDGPGSERVSTDILAADGVDAPSGDGPATGGSDGGPGPDAGIDAGTDDSGQDAPAADKDTPPVLDAAVDGGLPLDASGADGAGRQWSTPLQVQGPSDFPTPSVAVSPATGDAVVAWYDSVGGVQTVHYAAASDTWSALPATLESRGTPLSVQAAVDGTGHYVVAWAQNDLITSPSLLGVWASYSADGLTWSNPPVLLAAGPSNADYGDVRVAVNRAGQGWVVWDQTITGSMSSSDPETIYAVFFSGTTAKTPVIVKAGTTNGWARERLPRVAVDGQGHGLAVWTEADPNPAVGYDSTWGAALADGTTPSPLLLESYDADVTFGGDVAMNANGQGVAIWAERRSSSYITADVFARRYSVSQGWDPEPPRLYAANFTGDLAVDEDRYGTVSIGFSEPRAAGDYQATFSTQAVGGTWSTANIESDDLAPAYTTTDIEPQVRTAFTTGDVLMAWRKRVDGSTFAPHFRWRRNGTWGVESEVGRIDNLYTSDLHIGVADDGRAVAAWTYYHCSYDSLHPDKCSDTPLSSLPASTKAAIATLFVAVYK